MSNRIRFQGLIAFPEGAGQELDLKELVLPEAEAQSLFKAFHDDIKRGQGFVIGISVSGDDRAITIRFAQTTQTAAFAMLSFDVNNEPEHIHGLLALLPKLDRQDDQQVLDQCRKYAALGQVNREAFDQAAAVDEPVAASFFADIGSANYPPLHSIIRILSAAFFAQFGIGCD